MLHIIFFILKMIGVIICLFLLLFVLLLFVPIRYSCQLDYFETGNGWIRVNWLFRMISGILFIEQNRPRIVIKLFGVPIRRKRRQEAIIEDFEQEIESESEIIDAKIPAISEPELESEAELEEMPEKLQEQTELLEQQEEQLDDTVLEEEAEKETFLKTAIRKVIQKIQSVWGKLFHIKDRLYSLWEKAKQKSITIVKKVASSKQKLEELKELLLEENSRQVYAFTKIRLFRLFRHMGPKKGHLYLHYGFEDPALTGELTGMMAVLMVFYENTISLEPDFQRRVLEGSFNVKGRFQIAVLLWTGIRFVFYKPFRVMIKQLLGKIR